MDIMVIVKCMAKLLLILILGFALNKTGVIDAVMSKKLSGLVVKITAPLLIISSALSATRENRMQILLLFGAGFLMYIGFILFAKLVTTLLRFDKKEKPIYECMMVFSNNSFMGFPVLQSILGDSAVFYSSMLHFSFNIFIYTYAVWCFRKAYPKEGEQEKKSFKEQVKDIIKCLLTPGFILIFLALIIFLVGIRDDGVIYETCYMVGNTTSALSMLVLGATFAQYPIKESFSDLRSYGFSLIRLFLIPAVTFGLCKLLGVNDYYTSIVTITNAMPVASMTLMIANEYEADTKIITRNIVVTTLLSIVTIPIVVGLFLV